MGALTQQTVRWRQIPSPALYQSLHLPIYKSTYDLCLYLEQVVHNFSRYHKYTLGADLRDSARRALKLVVRLRSAGGRLLTRAARSLSVLSPLVSG